MVLTQNYLERMHMKKYATDNIVITDYSDEFLGNLGNVKQVILEEIGITAEAFAKSHETAVDTGRLRNSITYATYKDRGKEFEYKDSGGKVYSYKIGGGEEDAVYVGTNVKYAPYIEFGTHKFAGIHFLSKAISDHRDVYQGIIKKHLDQL